MRKKSFYLLSLALLAVFLITSGLGCKTPNAATQKKIEPIELNYWRVWDENDAFKDIIAEYQKFHPNIKINYRKFRYEEYEKELLDAWAEDRGPDIFSIPESWIREYETKIAPMPEKITMAFQEKRKIFGIKNEIVNILKTANAPSLRQIKESFADTVYQNTILENQVYGLPLSLETLVLFYNKEILNQSGISQLPATWADFQEAVVKMVRYDSEGKISRAGAALGSGANVSRAFDILSTLIMQNGAVMTNANGQAIFFTSRDKTYNPGLEAVKFYTDFASPAKNVYTWNDQMANSLDSFIAGKTAFAFGYNYNLPIIRSRAPQLKFGIAPIPQVNPGAPINYASYWVETVSKKSKYSEEAWDFIIFATTKSDMAKKFLDQTKRPTALKSLINSQLEDDDLHVAATQILTGANWYRGRDALAAEEAVNQMIDQVINAATEKEIKKILENAIKKINQTL